MIPTAIPYMEKIEPQMILIKLIFSDLFGFKHNLLVKTEKISVNLFNLCHLWFYFFHIRNCCDSCVPMYLEKDHFLFYSSLRCIIQVRDEKEIRFYFYF